MAASKRASVKAGWLWAVRNIFAAGAERHGQDEFGDAFGRGIVGQHGFGYQVADGRDAGDRSLAGLVHQDMTSARIGIKWP